ncbi:hypothetical protein, partial [uncultured Victivallis sp.]|uniref:hypothetical protein n=1 Tax=uncultured Victivallis sp. TaxID=354118 RepID=UPI002598969B
FFLLKYKLHPEPSSFNFFLFLWDGCVIILKFSLTFRIITGHKLVVMSYADGSGGPIALRTSPLASELLLTCEALPFAGGASAPYLSGCARQLLTVRYAHYAEGASLSTFGFVTIVPRYFAAAK